MYLTTLKRISGQYFHEENVTSDRFYSELEKVTLISETDSNGVHTFKPIVGRSVFKEHINQKQVAQIIKTIIQSLESKGESIRDISCIPGWIQNFSIIDHTLGQPRSTMLLLSQVGANVIYDTLKIACASRGYTARLFKFLDLEQVKIWKKHFKRAIDEVNSSNQHTVVFCASFAPGTDFLSVFEEMEAFLDGGRIQHLYSNAEYEDFVNKFYANVSKADQETSLNQRQEEGGSSNGGLFVPSILFARHLSLKIKLVLILDGGDSRNLQLFCKNGREDFGRAREDVTIDHIQPNLSSSPYPPNCLWIGYMSL